MASLSLQNLTKSLGGNPILKGIDLAVADGQLVVLVGPSGCGKSTLLRTIAGLEVPDGGTIHIDERDVTHLAPRDRDVAMVFQSYALYPHLRVRENLAFGLRLRRTDAKTIEARVGEVARMLGLEDLLERYPRQLSGGQRQRVAMGRAIARRPSLFLFDEPLSNLDAALRTEVRVEIKKLHAQLGATIVYVTHDQVEAMTLADQLVVLRAGAIEQLGPPLDVYHHPQSRFVASFMGSPAMNFLPASLRGGRLVAKDVDAPLPFEPSRVVADGEAVLLGARPHDMVRTKGAPAIRLHVDVVEAMGFETFVHGHVGDHAFVARLAGDEAISLSSGAVVELDAKEGALHLFDAETEKSLRPRPEPAPAPD